MKKIILAIAMVVASVSANAQDFYTAFSVGASEGASQTTLRNGGALQGSYGEGYHAQLRMGYFFNETFGVDLGVGYLHGNDQQVADENGLNIVGRGRAFGISLAGVANLSENVYVRAGVLSKLAGQTEVEGTLVQGPLKVEFDRDNKGSFPLGYNVAFGVKFKLSERFDIFAEMEYQGIAVPADKSVLNSASVYLNGNKIPDAQIPVVLAGLPVEAQAQIGGLIADEITFTDNPTAGKPEAKGIDAPYSSFGINVGVVYSFDF